MRVSFILVLSLVSSAAFADESIICSEVVPYYWREGKDTARFAMQRGSVLVNLNDHGTGTATWMTNASGTMRSGNYDVQYSSYPSQVDVLSFSKTRLFQVISTNPPARITIQKYLVQVEDLAKPGVAGGTISISFESSNMNKDGYGSWQNEKGTEGGSYFFCSKRVHK